MRARRFLPGFLALVVPAACGKPNRGPEITLANLETTKAPVNASMIRSSPQAGSKITTACTPNRMHPRWKLESTAVGGWLDAGPGFPVQPADPAKPGKVAAKAGYFKPATR